MYDTRIVKSLLNTPFACTCVSPEASAEGGIERWQDAALRGRSSSGGASAIRDADAGSKPVTRPSFSLPGTLGFAAGRITALAAFLFEVLHVRY